MRRILIAALATLVFALAKPARAPSPLKEKLDAVLANSPKLASAFVGISIVSLPDGRPLYERDAKNLFAPASNTKLFTTALALTTLGPQYQFATSVLADAPVDESGRVAGDLIFVGGGDPTMSSRHYPYAKPAGSHEPPSDVIPAIEQLADQVVAKGVRRIDGAIVGDDRRYVWEPYPDGWSADDPTWEYGAAVSALVVNDNSFALSVKPGDAPGHLARFSVAPALEAFVIDNRVVTTAGGERKISIHRAVGSHELFISGTIPVKDDGKVELLAAGDPALFAARMLRDALTRRGVSIRGDAVARHRRADESVPTWAGVELAHRTSPPLAEVLQTIDKVSQNLHAEIMLREVGTVRRGQGSSEGGQAEMKTFLAQAGISADEFHLVDGSGLSRLTLVAPAAVTKLLAHMYRSRYRQEWISFLPIGGVDGTLRSRWEGHPEAARIQAKTGSLSHVRALSGYAESAHGRLAFSFIVNDSLADPPAISQFLDTMGLKLLE